MKNLKKNHQKLFLNSLKFLKKIIKKNFKIIEKSPIKYIENPSRAVKKNFFSNQTKNKYKLIFNQNKKKIIFFWDLKNT